MSKLVKFGLCTFLALILIQATGCASAFLAPIYLIKGGMVDPEFKKQVKEIPKEAKIAVICRSSVNLYGEANPNKDMSSALTHLINKSYTKKKWEWIPYEKVEGHFDENTLSLESFERIGKKIGADYVIGVDMDSFKTQISSQFYQGKSKVHMQIVNVETGEVVVRKTLPEYVYPPTPVPINDKHQSEFQKQFIVRLAGEISTLLCPHDPHDKYAIDSDFPER